MTGKELKELVKGTGVSIAELARKMGKTTQNISYIFNAKSVKMEKIERIAEALGKDISYFVGMSPERRTEAERLLREKEAEIQRLEKQVDALLEIIERRKA